MSENNFVNAIDSLMKGMDSVIGSKTVVGEPTQIGDTIIVPLVDVSFGAGAGSGNGDKKNTACGGVSAKISPSAVLVIKNGTTKLVNIKNQDTMTKIIDLVPDILDKFTKPKDGAIDDDKAVSIAFPNEEQ